VEAPGVARANVGKAQTAEARITVANLMMGSFVDKQFISGTEILNKT
jgi:hypothetical protein